MKEHLELLVRAAIKKLQEKGHLGADLDISIQIERARDRQFGDFACNIAMVLAKIAGLKPRDLASLILEHLPQSDAVKEVTIAGPGFINFFVSPTAFYGIINEILTQQDTYGHSTIGQGKSIHIEFVSANPTGPLHVGHGRGAAYGAAVADLLEASGFKVHREYYVNDAGRQMDILTVSIWLRYLESLGETLPFPSNGYRGEYINTIAAKIHASYAKTLLRDSKALFQGVPPDANSAGEGDKEAHIDGLISNAKVLLGETNYAQIFKIGLETILADIREDLAGFGIQYQEWFSERTLEESNAIQHAIEVLRASEHLYSKDGALWFHSIPFGDDKDRVLVRENGQTTYFASDIAYHLNKFERGFDQVIDVLGADHHGYVPRVRAAIQAMGYDPSKLDALLVQFAILYRGHERVQMSTRSGSFVTLRELREEVGKDAARFFYVTRKCEQHMDFDLELAKSQSNDNPVYYIQYAHARICSVFRQLTEKNLTWEKETGISALHKLQEDHEKALLVALSRYQEVLETAALAYEPHQLANFLRELANDFHTYYNAHQFLVNDSDLRNARLSLICAVRQILANGLKLLGVSSPEVM